MGCFSFKCLCCGKPVRSNSFRGERVQLFLLKNGVVIERMSGEYDSYGRVFDDTSKVLKSFSFDKSVNEQISYDRSIKWETMEWGDIVDLMFDGSDLSGIAAIHQKCLDKNEKFELIPKVKSEDDPDQGWGPFTIDGQRFK